MQVHIRRQRLPLGEGIDLDAVASETTGFTGADLANVVNEAALLAGRREKSHVDGADFSEAIERAVAGVEKKRSILQGEEKRIVAAHEAGHAVLGTAVRVLLPHLASEVERLSIVPRSGGALGSADAPPGRGAMLARRRGGVGG